MTQSNLSDIRTIRRLLRDARPYWLHIVAIFAIDLMSTPLMLLTPVPLKIAVDNILGGQPLPGWIGYLLPSTLSLSGTSLLVLVAVSIVLIALLTQLRSLGSDMLNTYTGEKMVLDFRARLFQHSQHLSLAYHDAQGTSDTVYRILWDSVAIRYVATDGIIPLVTALVTLLSMIYIIFRLDWQLALVALAISPLLFYVSQLYRNSLRKQSREMKKLESAGLSVIQESLATLRVVKAFGQEEREQGRFIERHRATLHARIRYAFAGGRLDLVLGLTTAIGTAAVLFIGVQNVLAGVLTLGSLLLIMSYLGQLYGPLRTLSRKVTSLQSHLASAERAYALLDQAPDVVERINAKPLERTRGLVTFQNVSFHYENHNEVLHNISFVVPPGMRVGIAGHTGAGKTTLVSLLMRFYDPTAGQILLDDVDLRDYKVKDLRNQFAIMLQEPVLFSTSITENIAYARPHVNLDDIMAAAKAANAHEFIKKLPDGYETQVGERGMRLSGGERQRIALARAFLKDAPVLIMDEPTSAVDMQTEAGIMEAMERLMQDRTTFIIAHRLTTLTACEILLVLENGHLVEVKKDVSATVWDALSSGGLGSIPPQKDTHA